MQWILHHQGGSLAPREPRDKIHWCIQRQCWTWKRFQVDWPWLLLICFYPEWRQSLVQSPRDSWGANLSMTAFSAAFNQSKIKVWGSARIPLKISCPPSVKHLCSLFVAHDDHYPSAFSSTDFLYIDQILCKILSQICLLFGQQICLSVFRVIPPPDCFWVESWFWARVTSKSTQLLSRCLDELKCLNQNEKQLVH